MSQFVYCFEDHRALRLCVYVCESVCLKSRESERAREWACNFTPDVRLVTSCSTWKLRFRQRLMSDVFCGRFLLRQNPFRWQIQVCVCVCWKFRQQRGFSQPHVGPLSPIKDRKQEGLVFVVSLKMFVVIYFTQSCVPTSLSLMCFVFEMHQKSFSEALG